MNPPNVIDAPTATAILREHLGLKVEVLSVRSLTGGRIHNLTEWITDGEPRAIVAKLKPAGPHNKDYVQEFESLKWLREHTQFPVPEPYGCVRSDARLPGICLLMEKLAGRNLAEAQLTAAGRKHFQIELARAVAELHSHHRITYGPVWLPRGPTRWLELQIFAPRMRWEFTQSQARLSPASRTTISRLIAQLPQWLPEAGVPTVVHGDLWATNIMVDDADPDQPRLTGFVDGIAHFADAEFELAYLRLFDTAGEMFFEEYARQHPLRPGFERRCRVYWLNTLLIHLRYFGDQHLPRLEQVVREIEALW